MQVRVQSQSCPDYCTQIRQIIQNVSGTGIYQFKLIVFFMLVSLFSNLEFNSSHLFYMNPSFYCDLDNDDKVTEVDACDKLQACKLVQAQTLTAELGLYCDPNKDDRIFIQSSSSFGSLGGITLSFFMSDRKGRKFSICLCFIFINFGLLIQYYGIRSNTVNLLWIAEMIYGFCGKTVYMNFIILCTRFLKKSVYEFVSVAWFFMSASTTIIIAIINQIAHDWSWLFCIYSIGLFIVTIISFFILHEDPIYYFDSGQYEQCIKVIKDIGKQNDAGDTALNESLEGLDQLIASKTEYLETQALDSEDEDYDYYKLLDCRIIQSASILGVSGLCYMMISSSLDLQLPGLKLEYDYNLIIRGISYIIGNITSGFLIKSQVNRKTGFLLSSVLCGFVGIMFGFKAVSNELLIQIFLITTLRISLCWVSVFWVRLKVDLFPEKYQATILAFIEFLSTFGKILGPLGTDLSDDKDVNAIFTFTLLQMTIGTIPVIFLGEKKIQLSTQQQSLKQIEKQ